MAKFSWMPSDFALWHFEGATFAHKGGAHVWLARISNANLLHNSTSCVSRNNVLWKQLRSLIERPLKKIKLVVVHITVSLAVQGETGTGIHALLLIFWRISKLIDPLLWHRGLPSWFELRMKTSQTGRMAIIFRSIITKHGPIGPMIQVIVMSKAGNLRIWHRCRSTNNSFKSNLLICWRHRCNVINQWICCCASLKACNQGCNDTTRTHRPWADDIHDCQFTG